MTAKQNLCKIKYDEKGLVPAIIQDSKTGQVLMLGYMNKESVRRTLHCGKTVFWSRSRKKYWVKGEESGNCQVVESVLLDCDGDTLLVKVKQLGKGACHEGYFTCFFRQICSSRMNMKLVEKKVFNPESVYKSIKKGG